ncbi:MAG: hypothetical protein LCH41_13715 [Armatimonadetes bacterium]|nr:hypothetical protein [Armatimonadota bacterium]
MNLTQWLPLAQTTENFWRKMPGSTDLYIWLGVGLLLGFGILFLLSMVPSHLRRWVVVTFTFLAGLPYVLAYLWPKPIAMDVATQLPNPGEQVGFLINAAIDPVGKLTNILQGFLLGVGIFSLLRVHSMKIKRKAENYGFSMVLIVCFITMATVGFGDWTTRTFQDPQGLLNDPVNWGFFNRANDLLFEGIYQQMDAAMFSMIAFFILSAAFRAFRIRSVEATVMMASALILMLNLMGALTFVWGNAIDGLAAQTGNTFLLNFKLTEMANWLRSNMQIPAIRAIDFGVGLGALAMGLRLWLGLERGGVSA